MINEVDLTDNREVVVSAPFVGIGCFDVRDQTQKCDAPLAEFVDDTLRQLGVDRYRLRAAPTHRRGRVILLIAEGIGKGQTAVIAATDGEKGRAGSGARPLHREARAHMTEAKRLTPELPRTARC